MPALPKLLGSEPMSVTQRLERSWSISLASLNMPRIPLLFSSVTWDVSQVLMPWLNEVALLNISYMLVALDVSQPVMSWSNAVQKPNMLLIVVTPEVSQLPMPWSNAAAS